MILVIGANGSMGRRYSALLKYMNKTTVWGVDNNLTVDQIIKEARAFEGVILATPTDTHYEFLIKLAPLNCKVLCEKPITKNADEMVHLKKLYEKKDLQMVMQYRDLDESSNRGESFYDYYNHGRDGLYWDCLQIIGLARHRVMLSENSPFWKCRLNGKDLDLRQMDYAYSWMLKRWFNNPKGDLSYLSDVHDKVRDWEKNARLSI